MRRRLNLDPEILYLFLYSGGESMKSAGKGLEPSVGAAPFGFRKQSLRRLEIFRTKCHGWLLPIVGCVAAPMTRAVRPGVTAAPGRA